MKTHFSAPAPIRRARIRILVSCLILCGATTSHASTAYGTLNNFDCVNDTGVEAHGFEIELDDVHSKDITYTYDYNHYGVPKITEDNADPLHPKVFVRYASAKNPDGTWAAYTAIPAGPIPPTQGHQFTNPAINFGGEHFGVGYYGAPTNVKYNWLIDDLTPGHNLIHGPPVYVATPTFTYFPVAPAQPVAQVQAVIVPPPPPAPPVLQFGVATWVKEIKTTTHNPNKVELFDLVDPDPANPSEKNWANGEPAEVEVEWRLLQTEFANAANPKGQLQGAPEDLPGGDEVITRRYEFYKYTGPIDAETGQAPADTVGPDGMHGVGTVTYADHFDPIAGEWVTVTVDTSTLVIVGEFFGAQMSGFEAAANLGLIDHIPDGQLNMPYAERTVVVAGAAPFFLTITGDLPPGMTLDPVTGVLSGTPSMVGNFAFTVDASDTANAHVAKTYHATVFSDLAPPTYAVATSASPANGGNTSGDGLYDSGANVTVMAVPNPGFAFVNWSEIKVFSQDPSYSFTAAANRTLVANFFAPAPTSIVSRKTHGAAGDFNVDLPLTGSAGIECRNGQGATADHHQVVFTFAVPITLSGSPTVSVSAPAGGTPGATASVNGSVVTVDLTGILNGQTITITLTNENGAGPLSVPMGILVGDTTGEGTVSNADVAAIQAQAGALTDATNFRADVNGNGRISNADVAMVQTLAGMQLPTAQSAVTKTNVAPASNPPARTLHRLDGKRRHRATSLTDRSQP